MVHFIHIIQLYQGLVHVKSIVYKLFVFFKIKKIQINKVIWILNVPVKCLKLF